MRKLLNDEGIVADYFIKKNKDIIMEQELPQSGRGQQGNPISNIGIILMLCPDTNNIVWYKIKWKKRQR